MSFTDSATLSISIKRISFDDSGGTHHAHINANRRFIGTETLHTIGSFIQHMSETKVEDNEQSEPDALVNWVATSCA